MLAQSTPDLILPNQPEGNIQWNVSAFPKVSQVDLSYDELAVFVINASGEVGPIPVQGRFICNAGNLIFTPYYPFEKGLTYTVRTKHLDTDLHSYRTFVLKTSEKHEAAELLCIYPSADVLPENLLRFYFYFSTPMKKGEVLKHIQLIDSNGDADTHAFMQFKEELWSPDGKRLTLLFDPGRIKRGVSTNVELGPALLEGDSYQIVISAEWQDVYGQKLSTQQTKTFIVGEAYRNAINIDNWSVNAPKAMSKQALSIQFDRIVDHALVQSVFQIRNDENETIEGNWQISENEVVVNFIPSQKWKRGHYQIWFDSWFEDVAGNNLNSLLDQLEAKQKNTKQAYYNIDFVIS
jgi:hypothetical protein